MENRIIKFRAWDSVSKIMYYQESLTGGEFADYDISVIIGFDNHAYLLREDEHGNKIIDDNAGSLIPMQYCGLKDKAGKEIYEGDIVKILYTDWASKDSNDTRTLEQYKNDIAFIGSIVFYRDRFCIESKSNKYGDVGHSSIFPGEHGFIEIIGNIYESPELLNPLNKQS